MAFRYWSGGWRQPSGIRSEITPKRNSDIAGNCLALPLTPAEQQSIALYGLVGELMNGGFHQYFYNSSGDLAPLAIEELKAVGATESLRILERAMATFPPGGYSVDRETRGKCLKAISDSVEAEIAAFDDVSDAFQGDVPLFSYAGQSG